MLNPHLTKPQGERLAAMQAASCPGMAHWAGSGPKGKTCRQCEHWQPDPENLGGPKFKRYEGGMLKPRRCRLFPRLTGGRIVNAGIPSDTPACNRFAPADSPPTALGPRQIAKKKAVAKLKEKPSDA